MQADIFIEFGPRAILALIGIITIIAGVWHIDKTGDKEGSKAYERAKTSSLDPSNITIPEEELNAAFPHPIAFLIG